MNTNNAISGELIKSQLLLKNNVQDAAHEAVLTKVFDAAYIPAVEAAERDYQIAVRRAVAVATEKLEEQAKHLSIKKDSA